MNESTSKTAPSASRPRLFFVGIAVLMLGTAVAGFWATFFEPLWAGTLDVHWLVLAHGIVFFGWLLLLLLQVALTYLGRVRTHQRLGRTVGVVWGPLIVISALIVLFGSMLSGVGADQKPAAFASRLLINFGFLAAFAGLFAAGIAYRRRPEVHKRLMVLATLVIMQPAVARLDTGFLLLLLLWYLPALLLVGYDLWTERRVHPATLGGLGIHLLMFSTLFVAGSDAWIPIGRWLADAARPAVEVLFAQ